MNPRAIVLMWLLTILMAAAIALGAPYIYGVAGLATIYTLYALLP